MKPTNHLKTCISRLGSDLLVDSFCLFSAVPALWVSSLENWTLMVPVGHHPLSYALAVLPGGNLLCSALGDEGVSGGLNPLSTTSLATGRAMVWGWKAGTT